MLRRRPNPSPQNPSPEGAMNDSARAFLRASGLPTDSPGAKRLANQQAHKTPEAAAEAGRIARRRLEQIRQQRSHADGQTND